MGVTTKAGPCRPAGYGALPDERAQWVDNTIDALADVPISEWWLAGAVPETWRVRMRGEKAGSIGSKIARASQMVPYYEHGHIVHATGSHAILEAGLRRFPVHKPFDLTDAAFWAWRAMRRKVKAPLLPEQPAGQSRWATPSARTATSAPIPATGWDISGEGPGRTTSWTV